MGTIHPRARCPRRVVSLLLASCFIATSAGDAHAELSDPILNFSGMTVTTVGPASPPDTAGDVGPNHFV